VRKILAASGIANPGSGLSHPVLQGPDNAPRIAAGLRFTRSGKATVAVLDSRVNIVDSEENLENYHL